MGELAKREALKKVYSGSSWAARVDKMKDDQVQAMYLRLKREGKIA